jgi:hypothetical protein
MTERDIIHDMLTELEKTRDTLRQQLAGVENQMYALAQVLRRWEEEAAAQAQAPAQAPDTNQIAMDFMGLRNADSADGDAATHPRQPAVPVVSHT